MSNIEASFQTNLVPALPGASPPADRPLLATPLLATPPHAACAPSIREVE